MTVLRAGKINANAQLGGANAHCTRKMNVPNADPTLLEYNQRPVGTDNLVRDVQARLDSAGITKVRKNGVRAIEHIISASPEFFNKYYKPGEGLKYNKRLTDEFFKVAQKWVKDTYGDENLVNFTIHMDEKTPHAHAFVVPITPEGRLSARHFTGGSDGWKKLKEQQTTFSKAVEHLGLRRGKEDSKATHQTIKEFYSKVEKADEILSKPLNLDEEITMKIRGFKAPERGKEGLLGKEKESEWVARIEEKANEHTKKQVENNLGMKMDTYLEAIEMLEVKSVKAAEVSVKAHEQRYEIGRLENRVKGLEKGQKSLKEAKIASEEKLNNEIEKLKGENNSLQRQLAGVKAKMEEMVKALRWKIGKYLKELSDRVRSEVEIFNKAEKKDLSFNDLHRAFGESKLIQKDVDKYIQEEKEEQGIEIGKRGKLRL